MKKLLIVKLGDTFPSLSERFGDFDRWIKKPLGPLGENAITVKPYDGEALPNPSRFDGVALTGSHAMVTDREDWSERTRKWIPSVINANVPLLGICYGHQLLACALGGEAGYNPNGPEYGAVDLHLYEEASKDRLFKNAPSTPPSVLVNHSQSVIKPPPGAVLLGRSEKEPHQAFCVDNTAWGVQFHPEFTEEISCAYIKECAPDLRKNGLDPMEAEKSVKDSPFGTWILQQFGRIVEKNI